MSQFFLIPTNENGVVLDTYLADDLQTALGKPFAFPSAFVYAHGWWTDASKAMQDYNHFTVGFAKMVAEIAAAGAADVGSPALAIGVHWPSMISEDPGALVNSFELATFYTMEKRADNIGENAGYMILRILFERGAGLKTINLVGHSFGCKVVLSLLEEVAKYADDKIPGVPINVVLLQAALDSNQLEDGDAYGRVYKAYPKLRLLFTVSHADRALTVAYPAARVINIFSSGSRTALGAAGPTQKVIDQFGGIASINVGAGFDRKAVVALAGNRLIKADLTDLHMDKNNPYKEDPFSGHHSDIFHPEIYDMIAGFVFGV